MELTDTRCRDAAAAASVPATERHLLYSVGGCIQVRPRSLANLVQLWNPRSRCLSRNKLTGEIDYPDFELGQRPNTGHTTASRDLHALPRPQCTARAAAPITTMPYPELIMRRKTVYNTWLRMKDKYRRDPRGDACIHAVARACNERASFAALWVNRRIDVGNDSCYTEQHISQRHTGRPRVYDRENIRRDINDPTLRSSFRAVARRNPQRPGRMTVSNAVHEVNWAKHMPRAGKVVNAKQKEKRRIWARSKEDDTWDNALMIDSTVVTFVPPAEIQHGVWGPRHEELRIERVSPPLQAHVYAGACSHGLSAVHFVTGTTGQTSPFLRRSGKMKGTPHPGVGGQEFAALLPQLIQQHRAKHTGCTCKMYYDKARGHTDRLVGEALSSAQVQGEQLPAPAYDINWMDWSIWSQLKREIYDHRADYHDLSTFKSAIVAAWDRLSESIDMAAIITRQKHSMQNLAKDGELQS